MTTTVKDVLSYLGQEPLIRIIKLRGLKTSKTLDKKRTTIAHSYKGNLKQLFLDLRKEDLVNILKNGITLNDDEYYIPNLSIMKVDEIRKITIGVFCNKTKSEKLVPISENVNIDLFSTKYSKEDIFPLRLNIFQESLKDSKEIFIASAYYDQLFFEKLFNQSTVQKFDKINIIFNGLRGHRLKLQKEELQKLNDYLSVYCSKCEIRLKMEQGIFHTKLYIFKGKKTTTFAGSINSTNSGLVNNEEIIIKISGDKVPFKKYFETIWKLSKPFDKTEEPKAKTLISFFRMGTLYFKPEYQFQFSYGPFSPLLNELSDDEKAKLVDPIPNSESETGIGPFSIIRALNINIDDHVSKDDKSRASIKPYSIETRLGYWVPTCYKDEFEAKFMGSNNSKKEKYAVIKEKSKKAIDKSIIEKYHLYCDSVKGHLERANVNYQDYIDKINRDKPKSEYDPFKDDSGFRNFLYKFKKRINDDAYIEKLCSGFDGGPLPEIWDDYAAFVDFKESFFDYLEFIEAKQIKRRIPKIVLRKLASIDKIGIEERLTDYLEKFGWDEKTWLN